MRELGERLLQWHAAGRRYAIVVVVAVSGSTPRPLGTVMAVDDEGTVIGGLSGGCVEAAVYELCQEALRSGEPRRERFADNDSDEFAVGLVCGGTIEVCVHPVTPAEYPAVAALSNSGQPESEPIALVCKPTATGITAVTPRRAVGAALTDAELATARSMLRAARTGLVTVGCAPDESTLFVESFATPPRMIICGAVDVTAALTRVGGLLGYHVTVCDARPLFATADRAPAAQDIVVDWPHRYLTRTQVDARTVVCVLTHDPKFDIPALTVALRMDLAYVGAMGSRKADAARRARLRAAGLTEAELARLHSPIGLDLGGRSAAETALAIGAEIVALRNGGSALPLHTATGPIHAAI